MTQYRTGNPLGSMQPRDLFDNAQNIDNWSNGPEPFYEDRFGLMRRSFSGMNFEFEAAQTGRTAAFLQQMESMGYRSLGSYEAGVVMTGFNDYVVVPAAVSGGSAAFFRPGPDASLPLTLTGDWATDSPFLRLLGDDMLRQELAAPDGWKMIGGLERPTMVTNIRGGMWDVQANAGGGLPSLDVLITGDSLAFNAFGYPADWPVSGAGYATENPFGLSSWAHLVRDLWVSSDPAFVPIQDVDVTTDCAQAFVSASPWNFGMNQKAVGFVFADTSQSLQLRNAYAGSKALLCSYVPAADAVKFTVDGQEYSTASPDGHYQSYSYFLVPVASTNPVITGVRNAVTNAPGGIIWVYGVGSRQRSVPKLTGKGAWTSGQILSEYSTLVAPYTPDVIFYIIGANDIGLRVPVATFAANVSQFVDLARAAKPQCEVVFITPPPSSSYTAGEAEPYIQALADVAGAKSCSIVDIFSPLDEIDPARYRVDNIHFSTGGDTTVFTIIKNAALPAVVVDSAKFTPVREAMLGFGGGFYLKERPKPTFSAVIQCAATPSVSYLWGGGTTLKSAAYSGSGVSSRLIVTPPAGYVFDSLNSVGSATAPSAVLVTVDPDGSANIGAKTAANAELDIIGSGVFLVFSWRKA